MNQVANRAGSAIAALASLKTGLQNVQQTLIVKGGDPYLRMLKDGTWVYGQEDVEVENGSQWACNPLSIMHGWVCWDRSKGADTSKGPLGEVMVGASSPLPPKSSLDDLGHDWDQQLSIQMKCLDGTDKDEQVLYKTASAGGTAAMDDLIKAIRRQVDAEVEAVVPVVVMGSSNYNHKTYGKTYVPELEIVKWMTLDGLDAEEPEEKAPEPAKEPEPVKATRTRKASVPEVKQAAADDEDAEIERMLAAIAAKKAAKDKAAAPVETEAQRRKRELQAQLDALEDDTTETPQQASEPAATQVTSASAESQPLRRRRA